MLISIHKIADNSNRCTTDIAGKLGSWDDEIYKFIYFTFVLNN